MTIGSVDSNNIVLTKVIAEIWECDICVYVDLKMVATTMSGRMIIRVVNNQVSQIYLENKTKGNSLTTFTHNTCHSCAQVFPFVMLLAEIWVHSFSFLPPTKS